MVIKIKKMFVIAVLLTLPVTIVNGRTYDIAQLGAVNDGKTVNTAVIQTAIDECSASGGGTVLVAGGGQYVTGTIYMKSFVTFRVESGTTLLGSPNIGDYAADTHKNMYKNEPHMDRCLIFAKEAHSFSFEGTGTIDGNGHGKNFRAQRPMLMRFLNCRHVHLTDLNIINPAAWTSAWLYCDDITVTGIRIHSRVNGNGDGLDFDGCTGVKVNNCSFDTSDDSICLQTSHTEKPCSDITISNCIFVSRWAGIRIGLLSRGNICSVTVTNCIFKNIGDSGLKIQMNEGAELKNMVFTNLIMENVPRPVFMTFCQQRACVDAPEEPAPMKYMGNFIFQNIIVDNSKGDKHSGFVLTGLPDKRIENITIRDVYMTVAGGGTQEDADRSAIPELDIKTLRGWWPEYGLFAGALPAYGLYARHIKGLKTDNFNVRAVNADKRPVRKLDDVQEAD